MNQKSNKSLYICCLDFVFSNIEYYLLTKKNNFKGVREITSLSCYLFFEIWYLLFCSLFTKMLN